MDAAETATPCAFRYGSVCSGIEAATVAWHPLGWRLAFLSEIDAFPRAVLAHHYPDTPLHGDFTTIGADDYGPIDLLVGGTPCQSFSVAGLRGGLADDRGNLALEFLRLADRKRPRWLVWENVPGVLSSGGGRDFGSILGGLVELGYGFAYRVLDAVYFGVPARRRRVFVVGHIGNEWQRAAAVLFERASLGWIAPPVPSRVFACFDTGVRSLDRASKDNILWTAEGFRVATPLEVERALGFPDGYTDTTKPPLYARAAEAVELGNALRPDACGVSRAAGEARGQMRPLRRGDEAPCGGSLPSDGIGSRHSMSPLQHQTASRGGHGVGDAGVGVSGRRRVADGPRYKALGNSMAVPVMRWIGQRIAMVEALQ